MAKNFYVILGVSRDADLSQIREAHRRLVRRHHFDTGTGSVAKFSEIQEAYETLSDASLRRLYDEKLKQRPRTSGRAAPFKPREAKSRKRQTWNSSPFMSMTAGLWSDVDEFFGGFVPGFFTTGRDTSCHKDLYVEIILAPDEAARGGLFPLEIPVREPCRYCLGTGRTGLFFCHACHGFGAEKGRREVEIAMPAGVADGIEACLSLEDIGLKGVDLNVLVSIHP